MRLRYKILISVITQLLLFALVPPLLTRAGLRAANWVRVWEYISDHEFFSTSSKDRVVLLGDSSMGTRYCHEAPDVPGAPRDDDCALRTAMEFLKSDYPGLSRFSFFDFTTNGTVAEAHLYYFLLMLSRGGDKIKYLFYSLPGKLTLTLHDRSYFVLNEEAVKLMEALPENLKTDQIRWLTKNYRERLEAFSREQQFFHERDRFRRFREIFWAHRSFVQDFIGDLKERYAPDSSRIVFESFLKKEINQNGVDPPDRFKGPMEPPSPESYFTKESDFLFLDVLADLTQKLGIKLVFYIPPNRVTCPPTQLEPCDSNIYRPIIDRYAKRNILILDHRRDPFLVPRDSQDGLHPTLHTKLNIAREFLRAIAQIEESRPR